MSRPIRINRAIGSPRVTGTLASRVGFEPTTKGLKVPCSTAELPAHERRYHAQIGASYDEIPGAMRQTGALRSVRRGSAPSTRRSGPGWTSLMPAPASREPNAVPALGLDLSEVA